jgi:D-amino-acid oxidase
MCLSKGVSFHRATVSHIKEAFTLQWPSPWTHKSKLADVVVNCTGLLASKLGGVMDERVVPMRGQLVVVANESGGMFGLSGADDMHNGLGECCYVIPRPAGIHLLLTIHSFASAT